MSDADSARPTPLRGRNGLERVLFAPADVRACRERLIERRGLEDLALHRRRRREQPGVDVGQRLRQLLPGGSLQERRQLEQLQVAHDAVGDVQFGVQAQLA